MLVYCKVPTKSHHSKHMQVSRDRLLPSGRNPETVGLVCNLVGNADANMVRARH